MTGLGDPEAVMGQMATPGLLAALGRRPVLGRAFLAAEGEPGREHVVLLSDAWWRRRFAADPAILGRSLTLNGEPYVVIGVMPAAFDYAGSQYVPWIQRASLDSRVLLFTAAVAVVTGAIFGLAPALTALRTRLHDVLQQSTRAATGGRRNRTLRDALVRAETVLCVVLLVAAGLLLRSILALGRVDPDFRAADLLTAGCTLRPNAYPKTAASRGRRQAAAHRHPGGGS